MDVEMPVMDGLTCARRLRQLEADGTLRGNPEVIAITANARTEQIESTMRWMM
jgi:CheY-like chemotaxis protein